MIVPSFSCTLGQRVFFSGCVQRSMYLTWSIIEFEGAILGRPGDVGLSGILASQ